MPKKTKEQKLQRQLKNATRKLKRALPHDPDGQNDRRAAQAKEILQAYLQNTGTKRKDTVGDLLCALMHLSDRDHRFRSFERSIELAYERYGEQTAEPFC